MSGVGAQRPGNDGLVVDQAQLVGERHTDIAGAAPPRAAVTPGSAIGRFDMRRDDSTIGAVRMTRRRDRQSLRLRGYDYTTAGAYFVTICTKERHCSLEDSVWQTVVRTAWRRSVCGGTEPPSYDFVIMPNHVHGIVWLPPVTHLCPTGVGALRPGIECTLAGGRSLVPERRFNDAGAAPLPTVEAGSLGAVVRAFKAASTLRINRLRETPGGVVWQRGYYDRVIRGDAELAQVRQYIRDNPARWAEDRNHPANLAASRSRSIPR